MVSVLVGLHCTVSTVCSCPHIWVRCGLKSVWWSMLHLSLVPSSALLEEGGAGDYCMRMHNLCQDIRVPYVKHAAARIQCAFYAVYFTGPFASDVYRRAL